MSSEGLRAYIQNSSNLDINENFIFSNTTIYVKDPMPEEINLQKILRNVEKMIPNYLAQGIDSIYVGQFQDLIDREVNSLYRDGMIFITNGQNDEEDVLDDLVHEIAHSVEERFGQDLYGDGELEVEFFKKRQYLNSILSSCGYDIDSNLYKNLDYNLQFDNFLYKDVGYSALRHLTSGLFISPYAITSLREYFANGFENYYLNMNLSETDFYKIGPVLFKKIDSLNISEDET